MEKNLSILITNDDGIDAEGIRHLARIAGKFGDVTIVAPASQCSAMSQRITLRQPMKLKKVDYPENVVAAYSLEGTPADCVKVAINYVMDKKPDLVFSGVNFGMNAGYDIAYSGTIGAAMEAIMNHIPAIAFSSEVKRTDSGIIATWSNVDEFAEGIVKELLTKEISPSEIWNINFPECAVDECKGIKWDVPVAPVQVFNDDIVEYVNENGEISVAEEGKPMPVDKIPENTDCWYILNKYISVGKVECTVL